jgi:hypothetical protein
MSVPTLEDGPSAESQRERRERLLERRAHRPLVKIVPERRRHRRVPVTVFGRFMREDKQEYPCQVINMSAGGMALLAPVTCQDGERIVAYLDNLGRLEGVVVRSFDGGFAMRILASLHKRERIANLLTWLINQKSLGLGEERKHERVVPRINSSKLILPNGDVHNCRVIDVSSSAPRWPARSSPRWAPWSFSAACGAAWCATTTRASRNLSSCRTPTAWPEPSASPTEL